MSYLLRYNHGDRVIVVDKHGDHEARGTIAGRHDTSSGPRYDVQPAGELSLMGRLNNLPEASLRPVGMPALVKGSV